MDEVNGIILSLNHEGRITFLNHYGQSFFGYSAEEILGKPMLDPARMPEGRRLCGVEVAGERAGKAVRR